MREALTATQVRIVPAAPERGITSVFEQAGFDRVSTTKDAPSRCSGRLYDGLVWSAQRGVTFSAWGPFWPWVTSNSTF